MKNLIFLLLISTISIGQIIPTDSDSIYYTVKYCNTAETIEDALTSWYFNGNIQDCVNPSLGMLKAIWPNLYTLDSYDCCCKVASTPGLEGAWNGYIGSPCETYLDEIGFIAIDENDIKLNGIYIDSFGRQYAIPPKGLSIMNKTKYYRL